MIIIILTALLTFAAFTILTRLLWTKRKDVKLKGSIPLMSLILITGLILLTLTGRLHWIIAAITAVLPFLRTAALMLVKLLGFQGLWLPFLRRLYSYKSQQRDSSKKYSSSPRNDSSLSKEEALEILGLSGNPDKNEIIMAHRKLIQKIHPDRGGSTYLAQKLNEAKRVLTDG